MTHFPSAPRTLAAGLAALALVASRSPAATATPRPRTQTPAKRAPVDAPTSQLQAAIFAARDAVLPALVHVEPIIDVFARGQKSKAAITGSGVIVDAQGHVLTNDHVVAHARRVTCILYDKRELTATVVGRDALTDVAILQLDLQGGAAPVAQLGSSAHLQAGQYVIAMGSPLGLARSISAGVVSTPDRYFPEDSLPGGDLTGTYNTWIQTDAAINPGNSGGPLVDLSGRVIGINARAVPIFGENIGFAIPIDVVKEVAADIIAKGRVERSWIGVAWQETKSLANWLGAKEGVLVGGVVEGGPAERAGLRPGDLLVAWAGRPVTVRFEEQLPTFRKLIADTPVGDRVTLTILRDGKESSLTVVTEQQPDTESDETALDAWGLTARDISPEVARRRRIRDTEGALVTGVKAAAPASVADLQEGDIIRDIEGHRVKNTADLLAASADLAQSDKSRLLVRFDRGTTHRLAVLEVEKD